MISEEILGGLKLAVSKGESLKQAMISFYNAGYKKEDIEEAARNMQKENIEQKEIQQKKPEQPIKQSTKQKPQKTMQKVSGYGTPMRTQIQSSQKIKQGIDTAIEQLKKINIFEKPETIPKEIPKEKYLKQKSVKPISPKKVSSYEKQQKPTGKLIIFILVFFLLFLLGVLTAIFFFRQEFIDFFNKLF